MWIDIAEALKPEVINDPETKNRVFVFKKDGIITNYKVMRVDKKRQKVWTKIIPLYTQKEFEALDKKRIEDELRKQN